MRCIGLMSGTSLDGIDGVLARLSPQLQVEAHVHRPMPPALRAELLALNTSGPDELHRAALAANALAEAQAEVVQALLAHSGLSAADVRAVGSHGQTVRHRPGAVDGTGYTWQLNQPALLAERCGIDVVADFRSRDVAAGGQGAPLVPAFHAQVFGRTDQARAVLNLGGIGNLTLLPAGGAPVSGFDCGPGNALLDLWVQQHLGQDFDADGQWAASGQVHGALLGGLMAEPYLAEAPPKSTGRDLFHADWLVAQLQRCAGVSPQDVQATLAEFTARAATEALHRHAPQTTDLLVCGGGALNADLMQRLTRLLPGVRVRSTAAEGLPPMQVEATAFAWLAGAHLMRQPANLPAVTGARGPRVLGALYPA
ncbi:anhydro-N-acetylmuramic acid kinase [Ideonella sp. 4Y16]|uniref:Anhydro-N-acetylmuramic acid kinase n=1 Tax=Ideonella alba TaxID=2824118 RepID=A0A940Y9D6_9BURK|nr:anhydro-N-acetylmuramic acid kinase [Ideonella alba]MBQ0932347.1 anhydro-N-acetylmuramic acid kinase [Ideonella alba]MBQ0944497.1 anhydro-N-acetylmuramic acid kinase [Ideonella alba]